MRGNSLKIKSDPVRSPVFSTTYPVTVSHVIPPDNTNMIIKIIDRKVMPLLPASVIHRFLVFVMCTFTYTQPSVLSLCHEQSRILN